MKELFAVIDMQNDFLTGTLPNSDAVRIVPNVVRETKHALERGATVIFTRDTHGGDYPSTREGRLLPVPHCILGTVGHEIIDELKPLAARAEIFDKPTFGSEKLALFAKSERFDKVTLVGVCTDICVISNAFAVKTALPEADVVVLKNCCAGVTPTSHATALDAMRAAQIFIE